MKENDLLSGFPTDRLHLERMREAISRVEKDAAKRVRQDAKEAADLHVAHLAEEINQDTAELNSPWCDLHRTNSDVAWRFEAIWQSVQHHLSRAGLYPAGDMRDGWLYAEFACRLSTFWLKTYADSEVVPDSVASEARELYHEDDFWPIYSAWYDIKAKRPGTIA